MTSEEIKAFVVRRNESLRRRDVAAIVADYAEDCVVESPHSGTLIGRAAVERTTSRWFSSFPDLMFEPHDVLSMTDRIVQTQTLHGTDTGGFLGQAPTGKPFAIFIVFLLTLRDHQIVHERRVYDLHGLMLQLAIGHEMVMDSAHEYRATLDRALMHQELKIAAEIQRALLPELRRKGNGFEVAAVSVPCRAIGGDFIDYFELPNDGFGFALGDVEGKGPPAALLAAELQGIMASQSYSGFAPAETLANVNRVLVRRTVRSFATLFYGQLSCAGRLTYSRAGHNPPLLVGHHGIRRLERGGLILGAFQQATFEEEAVQLSPGDAVVAFSDGLTEALNTDGVEFGDERLLSCVSVNLDASPTVLLECLLSTVHEFTVGATPSDDLTALVLRYSG
jgi:serine phosphatase RsbU (regulator of sigma subunit)